MQYRPFTLEGNFLEAQAVHEMSLQSWSPALGTRDTEVIRIFPAAPWRWHDVSSVDCVSKRGRARGCRESVASVAALDLCRPKVSRQGSHPDLNGLAVYRVYASVIIDFRAPPHKTGACKLES